MSTLPPTSILPPRTIAAAGASDSLLAECAGFGRHGLVVHGRSLEHSGTLARILSLRPAGTAIGTWLHPGGEPSLAQLGALLQVARETDTKWIAAVGGGSVMDIAKAAAGLLHAGKEPVEYHDGAAIEPSRTPFIAVPTTAGTGSESTIVTVLTNTERGVKKSIRHPSFIARLVLLDPRLLATCPREVIASSGMDALTQALESFVSSKATWLTDCVAERAIGLIAGSLRDVYADARNVKANDLLVGSYLAGIALSNARLGIVHGLAHPLGVRYSQPHGLVCAVCLPLALEFNRPFMADKYDRIAALLGGDPLAEAKDLLATLGVRSPFAGERVADMDGIVAETLASGSTAANPRPVGEADVRRLLRSIFG